MKNSRVIERVREIGEKAAKWLVLCIFAVCIFILFWQSMVSTAVIDRKEHISFVDDSVLFNIIFLGLFLAAGIFFKLRKKNIFPIPDKRILNIITIVYILMMFVLVLTLQIVPTADQGSVLECAGNLLEGNFEKWRLGGYLYNYPNQNGIVLVFSLFCAVFGDAAGLVIQVFNIWALVICAYYCSKTIKVLFDSEKLGAYSYIFLLGFLGINCYVTFVYGTIFGMTAAAVGIYHIIGYTKNRKIYRGIIGVLLVGISFLFKENYLIFIVAAMLLLLCDALFQKKWKSLILFIGGILFCIIVNISITLTIESITKTEVSQGVPSKAWVAMGLQDGTRAPGWYNGYNVSVYINNQYDYEKASEVIDADIKERLKYFKNNKSDALDFFSKKIESQWNEGTFQGFWILETRKKGAEWPELLHEIIYVGNTLNSIVVDICDFLLSFLWLGVVLFILFGWKELDVYKLIYAIVFIGGFIFHLFWEAKGQYTVVYVYFMIPYMVRGYQMFFTKVTNAIEKKNQKEK